MYLSQRKNVASVILDLKKVCDGSSMRWTRINPINYLLGNVMSKKKSMVPGGAVLCFVIYIILCGQIITLLENNWLIIPDNLQYSFNRIQEDGTIIKVITSVG